MLDGRMICFLVISFCFGWMAGALCERLWGDGE